MTKEAIFHVIKDPVHGTMQWAKHEDGWLKPFIDSPNVQRLRHIKQLGMSDFIFPGAVHTRFNHSLGCTYIASQIANKIGLADEEKQLVILACLLHDIGHGPFSHTFEEIFHRKLIRHEAWTPFFLAEYNNPLFFEIYHGQNPRHHLTPEKFKVMEDMIMHKAPVKRLLADIVSSQLDADRLDYLLRDSHFCGVSYGEFDIRWMLNSMIIVNTEQGERLGLTHKGIGVVEHYLMARRLMIRNIYFHQKKIAFEYFLIKLLAKLAETLDNDDRFSDIKTTDLGRFLIQVNHFNQLATTKTQIEPLKTEFLKTNYPIYKALSDYDVIMLIKKLADMSIQHPIISIAKRLQYRQMPKIVRLDQIDSLRARSLLNEFKEANQNECEDWQIELFKTPHQSYTIEEDPILIMDENQRTQPINEISLMIKAMSNKLEEATFLCIDKSIYNKTKVQHLINKISTGTGIFS